MASILPPPPTRRIWTLKLPSPPCSRQYRGDIMCRERGLVVGAAQRDSSALFGAARGLLMCSSPDPHTPERILTPTQTHPGTSRHMLQHTGAFEWASSRPTPTSAHTATHHLRALGPHHQPHTSSRTGTLTRAASSVGAQRTQGSHIGGLPCPPRPVPPGRDHRVLKPAAA